MDYNDYELVYMVKENDEEAFNLILKKYEPLIKNLSKKYASRFKKFRLDREDLEQECRLGLYRAISLYDSTKDVMFYTFLLICIRRRIATSIRSSICCSKCNDAIELDSDDNFLQVADDYYLEPDYLMDETEDMNIIINFKNSLDFIDSQIFELKFNCFSYKEISSLLELTKKQIDNRMVKIRNKLKKYLLEFN